MDLWHWQGHAVDLPGVHRLLATNHEELQQEYANFVEELFDHVNK